MEQSEFDWKNIVSHYELDEAYERINAPKWIDFSAPHAAVDDVAWFCRPDCRHPITYEDFDRWKPSPLKVKLFRPNLDAIEAGDQNNNQRNANLKKRGGIVSFFPSPSKHKLNSREDSEDIENQNPNMETTPLMMKTKKIMVAAKKEAIKSSAEKRVEETRDPQRRRSPPRPRLKSTFSARNLFSGKDILSQISEFCHELKKLAAGKASAVVNEEEKGTTRKTLEEDGEAALKESAEEEKALISTIKTTSLKKKSKLVVKPENNEEKKSKILKEARAHPPTPQRFPSPSTHHHHHLKSSKPLANSLSSSSPLSKVPKSKSPERGALQELDQRREKKKLELIPRSEEEESNRASVVSEAEEEESTVDLFWFLKSCTYLS